MARIKIAYIGGGSTRAAGTMASFVKHGERFAGSEVVLIDLDADRLELIRGLAERMAAAHGAELAVSATTDRRAGLEDCDAILTSFRPGGFEARVLDEKIPLSHGVIGQETQGPGGFFMALRSIAVMREILDDVAAACPGRGSSTTRTRSTSSPRRSPTTATSRSCRCARDRSSTPRRSPRRPASIRRASTSRASGSTTRRGRSATTTTARTSGRSSGPPGSAGPTTPSSSASPAACCASRPRWTRSRAPTSSTTTSSARSSPSCRPRARPAPRTSSPGCRTTGATTRSRRRRTTRTSTRRARAAGIDELELAIECMDAVFNDTGDTLPVNVPNAGSRARLPRLARRRDARPLRPRGHPPAADAGAAEPPAGARRGAGLLPAGGRRRGLVGRRARRGPGAGRRTRSCARSTWPSSCTPRWPRRTGRSCPSGSSPA